MRRGWVIGVVLVAGCGEDPLPPAELGEVCGEAGPVRVLELEPGRRLTLPPTLHDGRVVLRTGSFSEKREGQSGPPWPIDLEVWSTGPCGESPVQLDAAVRDVVQAPRWPELLLGYRAQSKELVTLDVTGEGGGHVVFAGAGPSSPWVWTEHGLVSFEARGADTGAALLHRYPDDPLAGTVAASELLAPVTVSADDDRVYGHAENHVLPDELFALQPDGTLISVALIDGAVTEERAGVKEFAVSPDGRWLAWQGLTDDPDRLDGPVFLRDREDGGELGLGDLRLMTSVLAFEFFADGLLVVDVNPYINTPQRVYTLATLDFVDLPPERRLARVLADGRWAIDSWFSDGVDIFDPKDGSVTPWISRGAVQWWGEDEVDVIDVPKCCAGESSSTDEGALFRVSLTGDTRELASRASRYGERLTDGRRITWLDLDGEYLGQLVLLDPDTGDSSRIDDRAFVPIAGNTSVFGGEDAIVYSVDDGARTGVWVARLGGD